MLTAQFLLGAVEDPCSFDGALGARNDRGAKTRRVSRTCPAVITQPGVDALVATGIFRRSVGPR